MGRRKLPSLEPRVFSPGRWLRDAPAIRVLHWAATCTGFSPLPVSLLVARRSMSMAEFGAGVMPCNTWVLLMLRPLVHTEQEAMRQYLEGVVPHKGRVLPPPAPLLVVCHPHRLAPLQGRLLGCAHQQVGAAHEGGPRVLQPLGQVAHGREEQQEERSLQDGGHHTEQDAHALAREEAASAEDDLRAVYRGP